MIVDFIKEMNTVHRYDGRKVFIKKFFIRILADKCDGADVSKLQDYLNEGFAHNLFSDQTLPFAKDLQELLNTVYAAAKEIREDYSKEDFPKIQNVLMDNPHLEALIEDCYKTLKVEC